MNQPLTLDYQEKRLYSLASAARDGRGRGDTEDTVDWETVARQTIKDIIKEKGVTQRHLAKRLGVHESLISKILAGGSVLTVKMLVEIARLLGVEPADLLPSSRSAEKKQEETGLTEAQVREICRQEIRRSLKAKP